MSQQNEASFIIQSFVRKNKDGTEKKKTKVKTKLEIRLGVDVTKTTLIQLVGMAIEMAKKDGKCFFPDKNGKKTASVASLCFFVDENRNTFEPADHENDGKELSKYKFKNGHKYVLEIRTKALKLKCIDDKQQKLFAENLVKTKEAEKKAKKQEMDQRWKERGFAPVDDDKDNLEFLDVGKLEKSWRDTCSLEAFDKVRDDYCKQKKTKVYDDKAFINAQANVHLIDRPQFGQLLLHFEKRGEMKMDDEVKSELREWMKGGKIDRKGAVKDLNDPQIASESAFKFIMEKNVYMLPKDEATPWVAGIVEKMTSMELKYLRKLVAESKSLDGAPKKKLLNMYCLWEPLAPLQCIIKVIKSNKDFTTGKKMSENILQKTRVGFLDAKQLEILRELIKDDTYWKPPMKSKLLSLDVINGMHLARLPDGVSGVDYVAISKQEMDYRRWKIVQFFGHGLHKEKANVWKMLGKVKTMALDKMLNIDINTGKKSKGKKLEWKGYDGTDKSKKKAAFQENTIKIGVRTLNEHVKGTNLKEACNKSVKALVESSTGLATGGADWKAILEIAGAELLAGISFVGQEMVDGVIPSPAVVWATFKSVKEAWKGSKKKWEAWRAKDIIKIASGYTGDLTLVLDKDLTNHIWSEVFYSVRKIGAGAANAVTAGTASLIAGLVNVACTVVTMALKLKTMWDDRKKFATIRLRCQKELQAHKVKGAPKKALKKPIWNDPEKFRKLLKDNMTPSLAAFLMLSGHFLAGDLGCFCDLTNWGPDKKDEYEATCRKLMGLREHAKYILREGNGEYEVNPNLPQGPLREEVQNILRFVYADRNDFFRKRKAKNLEKTLKAQQKHKKNKGPKQEQYKAKAGGRVGKDTFKRRVKNFDAYNDDDDDDDDVLEVKNPPYVEKVKHDDDDFDFNKIVFAVVPDVPPPKPVKV